ncbi:MAG: transglycosylase domain-containing protein, partial [Chloroflexota bacterium]
MSDIHDNDSEYTRPSKPLPGPDEERTRPMRPIEDPDRTILSPSPIPKQPSDSDSASSDSSTSSPNVTPSPPQQTPSDQTKVTDLTQLPPAQSGQLPDQTRMTDPSQLPPAQSGQLPYQTTRTVKPDGQGKRPSAFKETTTQPVRRPPAKPRVSIWRWLFRGGVTLFILSILVGVLALGGSVITYFWIASQLPPAETLRSRSHQFVTTQILDRNGNLLWEIIDPTGGRRTTVGLNQISPDLINATVATEDRFFYLNVGVDPVAVARAVYYNVSEGDIVSGASTITQQLARNVLLSQEERTEQTLTRKVREAVLAVEINRRYTKDQILEIYLNQIYYGNLAYGIEAAAQSYFGIAANDLTLAEAALLAGLPQSPAIHDPYVNPEGAARRQSDVLRLMAEARYISAAEAEAARNEELIFRDLNFAFEAPHFVSFVRQELETIVPPDYIYQAGLKIQTTLDPRLQAIAEEEVRAQVDNLAGRNVSNGALVAVEANTGQLLALVGSKDFRDEAISGQVNMAVNARQPGSSIKPFTYLATFELLNWTPSTLIMDVP